MKFAATTTLLAGAALAQQIPGIPGTPGNSTGGGGVAGLLNGLTPSCQQALFSLASDQQLLQCLQVPSLVSLSSGNGSIIPPLDSYLSTLCGSNPCSNATLQSTAQTLINGCSTELGEYDISNSTVFGVFNTYPLVREVACLKTSTPAAANFSNATIPINSTVYNSTNGTFCATSLLTELSAYLGANLTASYIANQVMSQNASALQVIESIPDTALCQDCIYAAVDLIDLQYPKIITQNFTVQNYTFSVEGFLNDTCMSGGFVPSPNATLPSSIVATAYNSTFPYTFTANGTTHTGTNGTTSSSSSAMKRFRFDREGRL